MTESHIWSPPRQVTAMLQRYGMLFLICVGIAMAIIAFNLFDALERTAACNKFGTDDACCVHGECRYKPASEESRPAR